MEDNNKSKEQRIQIEIPEELQDGVYANMAVISHSPSEFVVDFIRILPNSEKAKVKSRVILTPEHAKRLLKALQENVMKYDATFGKNGRNSGLDDDGYNPPFPINLTGSGEA